MGLTILYVLLAALAAVGVYECHQGLRIGDRRSASIWGLIASIMAGLLVFIVVTPPDWVTQG